MSTRTPHASFTFCDVSHRVTITLPFALSMRGKNAYLAWLQREMWEHAKPICWVADNTIRFVARAGKDLADNMLVLKQFAQKIVEKINSLFKQQ